LQNKLHFSRFEFKYILPDNLRKEVESELRFFLQLDPYVEQKPGKKYIVRSLYFDDPVFSCFSEKEDGMQHRYKFRHRTYTDDPLEECPSFLEIKGRHDALVFKHRIEVESQRVNGRILTDRCETQAILSGAKESDVLNKFRFDLMRKELGPVMLIDYRRRPYISKYDPEFRLTFDEKLYGTRTKQLFPNEWENKKALLLDRTVMEVKFRRQIPSWFHRIIQYFGLRRVSISKVNYGIKAFGLTPYFD